ncbi:MAG: hypothetical protein KAK00_05550 [Nanoarchaeota archaeon]|nr:hypothetical protein [Nanoarchaeota archaeon]
MASSREKINIESHLIITEQGVLDDYINNWFAISLAKGIYELYCSEEPYESGLGKELTVQERNRERKKYKKEIKRMLKIEVPTYESYLEQKYPDLAEKILKNSDPERINALNLLAEVYNSRRKSISEDLDVDTAKNLSYIAAYLINGMPIPK